MKRFWSSTWEIIEVIAISAAAVFLIRQFLAQPFLVSGASMEPNFQHGNYLIIDELTYRFRGPERGEVIVFRYPNDRSTFFIKRIAGLPGEQAVVAGGRITVYKDGEAVFSEGNTNGSIDVKLKADEYFVIGDNRYNSFDSRNWGPVSRKDIIGVARVRVLPFNEFGIIDYTN